MMHVVGGVGFVNAPRAAFCVMDDPDWWQEPHDTETDRPKLLLPLKSNIGPLAQGLRFKLVQGDGGYDEEAEEASKRLTPNSRPTWCCGESPHARPRLATRPRNCFASYWRMVPCPRPTFASKPKV